MKNTFDASAVAHNFLLELEEFYEQPLPNYQKAKDYLTALVQSKVLKLTNAGGRSEKTKPSLLGAFGPVEFNENNLGKVVQYAEEVAKSARGK